MIRPSEATGPRSAARRREAAQELVERVVDLNRTICNDLSEGHPAAFLLAASVVHSCCGGPIGDDPGPLDLSFLLDSLAQSELAGFRAVSYALSRMIGTEHLREVVDQRLGSATDEFPDWLRRLDETKITGCWRGYDVYQLLDIVGVGFRLPDGQESTLVVVTRYQSSEILSAYVSSLSYADSGLTWARMDPSAEAMTWTPHKVARFRLECALSKSDPSAAYGVQVQPEWAHHRVLITWLISLLDGELTFPPLR